MTRLISLLLTCCLAACSSEQGSNFVDSVGHGPVALTKSDRPWLVVNYWAQWCAPCREEIPELNALALPVVGVDFDAHKGEQLDQVIAEMGIQFPVLVADPASQLQSTPPSVLPSTLLIDAQGQVQAVLTGPQTQTSILAQIEKLSM